MIIKITITTSIIISINYTYLANCFRYCLCRLGAGELGSYSRHPTTSNIASSENLNGKIRITENDFLLNMLKYVNCGLLGCDAI
jgi:hypothetical protein